MSELAQQLRELRYGPERGVPDEVFVSRVMAACRTADSSNLAAVRRRRYIWGGAAAAALIALAASIRLYDAQSDSVPGGSIAARGGVMPNLSATVEAFVGRAAPGAPSALLEGAVLHPGDGILVRYSNPDARDVYLMVFAIDTRNEVHWIHPAYLNRGSNPTSLKLEQSVIARTLDEVAEPEDPAPGQLRVYALLSHIPLDVRGVEVKLAAAKIPVQELFGQAEVEEWRCMWLAR